MNSPRDLRRRIKSISGTAQITKAMQMVAASKMRKAQQAAHRRRRRSRGCCTGSSAARPSQAPDFDASAARGARGPQARGHPDRRRQGPLRRAQHQRVPPGVAVRSGDDGLHHRRDARRRSSSRARAGSWPPSSPTATRRRFAEARAIAAFARDLFLKGEVDEVQIVATRFVNTLTQEPVAHRVPAGRRDHRAEGARRGTARRRSRPTPTRRCSSRTPRPSWAICSATISTSTSTTCC